MSSFQKEGQIPRFRSNSTGSRFSMDDRAPYSPGYAEAQPQYPSETFDFHDSDEYDEPTLTRPVFMSNSSHSRSQSRPLIDYVKNEWRTNPKFGRVYSSSEVRPAKNLRMLLSYLAAPKVRRYIVVYLLLIVAFYFSWKGLISPYWSEQGALARSLNVKMKSGKGWFGANARPEFIDMIHLKTLDSKLIPNGKTHGKDAGKRLVLVGDVHGCKNERTCLISSILWMELIRIVVELMDRISFRPKADHL